MTEADRVAIVLSHGPLMWLTENGGDALRIGDSLYGWIALRAVSWEAVTVAAMESSLHATREQARAAVEDKVVAMLLR